MNYADSEKINMIMLQSWIRKVSEYKDADFVILNTCSVRKKWEDKVYSLARDIQKFHEANWKKCFVWLTWCMIRKTWISKDNNPKWGKREATKQIDLLKDENSIFNSDDKIFGKTDKIDFVFRIEEIPYLTKILSALTNQEIWNDEKFNEYLKVKQLQENPWSANVVIQTGCDNFCTYCIVPFTRWREKSRNRTEIIDEIQEVTNKWTKEIILIWQNVNSFWKETRSKLWNPEELKWENRDTKTPFRELMEEIEDIAWIDRLRFTSSNPHDMTKDILDAHFELKKTCNYMHFALQSWDDEILKKMNRKHTYKDFKTQVEYLRSKDPLFSISTDIIVWFPWETIEQFENTIKAMKEIIFDFAYIARYSGRPWTFADKNLEDSISSQEKARRWHILNNMLEENVRIRSELMIWRTEEILVQWLSKWGKLYWRTRNFKEVYFDENKTVKIWDLIPVKIEKSVKWILEWKII